MLQSIFSLSDNAIMKVMNQGFAAYLAKKKTSKSATAATNVPPMQYTGSAPMAPMHPQMVAAIKASPKGQIPPGLAKWLATHKKGKKAKK